MDAESFYRRPLPEPTIAFSSTQGREVFREALGMGGMAGYFPLAEQFHTQAEPAFCGLGTLVIILNALSIDPKRIWKGVWRWYVEEFLECCQPLSSIKEHGITFDEFVCLARCNGAIATPYRYHQSSLAEFRATVEQVCFTPEGIHLVAAYSRSVLGQTGDGHFSPIGGYHPERDLVLLLDVARFKYPPHWVPLSLLWQALEPIDPTTNRCRGYITLQKSGYPHNTFFQVALNLQQWSEIAPGFSIVIPAVLKTAQPNSPVAAISMILQSFPETYSTILGFASDCTDIPPTLQTAIRTHPLGQLVAAAISQSAVETVQWMRSPNSLDDLTVLLLACPDTLYQTLNSSLQTWFCEVRQTNNMNPLLAKEVLKLRAQMTALQELVK